MISELCLCDLTGAVRVVLRHEGHIEAPNWHPDGYLIVNGGGRLYRVPLDAPALHLIDTGHAVECNNDHGISPDGQTLVISDKSRTGESCIYTLPVGGVEPGQEPVQEPVRITEHVPSWWHGWSPDGLTHAYAAARVEPRVVLMTCPAAGGPETLVCDAFDHIDGPDYTPDGQWIWFNGEREGTVDLWRIRPDGSGLQRMTDDEAVNWFPHPSPDGAHVVYLAYPAGTQGHPGGCDVSLRLMDAEGGASRLLTALHGGQGTINVPSWAPDGQAFAFMRYGS